MSALALEVKASKHNSPPVPGQPSTRFCCRQVDLSHPGDTPTTPIHRHPDPIPEKIEKFHNGVYNYPAVLSGNVLKNNLRTVCIQFGSFSTTRREQTGTEVAAPTVPMWNPKSFLRKTSVPLHTDTGTNRIGSYL